MTKTHDDAEADAARVLLENHRAFLRFLERRVGGRRDLAEDILQEAFVRGMAKLGSLRDDEALLPWFYRTLRNAAVDALRRGQAADRALARFADAIEAEEVASPEAPRAEVCRCVTRLATALKPEYAEALRRIEVDGVSVKDFAHERGISTSNAAVRVFRAREALRRRVAATCGACADHGCVACTCAPPGHEGQDENASDNLGASGCRIR